MADGTALPRFKRAFIAKLKANGVPNVSYQSPMQPDEIWGDDGSGLSGWFDDTATGALNITVMGAHSLWIDETWQIPFRVQALGVDTDTDQEAVDQAACGLLGDVMTAFSDPSFGIVDDAIQVFCAVPVGAEPWFGGTLPTNQRAARYELTIELTSRLQIVGS
jgi:hypothetical protein